jgi:hypothetical protein
MVPMTLNAGRDSATGGEPVQLADLSRELGIPVHTRRVMLEQGLVTPLQPPHKGHKTRIPAKDADDVRQAWVTALKIGISVIVVLKVLRALDNSNHVASPVVQ